MAHNLLQTEQSGRFEVRGRGFLSNKEAFLTSYLPFTHTLYVTTLSHFTPLISNDQEASGVHDYIKERTIKIGKYIVETRKTVRVIAKEFGVSKSTVHKDLTERLPEINPELANEVKEILDYHKAIRHLRGGEATKNKYKLKPVKEEPANTAG